jgi:cell fate regulator YaaT (PSP1 superfamily)
MCCLQYEAQTYKALKRLMPNVGEKIELEMGKGKVVDRNLVKHSVEVDIGTDENIEVDVDELDEYDLDSK